MMQRDVTIGVEKYFFIIVKKSYLFMFNSLLRKYFNITATGPYLYVRKGSKRKGRNGKLIVYKKPAFFIAIYRKKNMRKFLNGMEFTIVTKQ